MITQLSRRLHTLSVEIASRQAELSRLRDRLENQRTALYESRLRMLIAETPLADRELHAAAESFLAVEEEVRRLEAAVEALRLEAHLLGGGLAAAGA